LPVVTIEAQSVSLLELVGLCWPEASNAHRRRLIKQGGVELQPSEERPTDPNYRVDVGSQTAVKIGKRRYYRLRPTTSSRAVTAEA